MDRNKIEILTKKILEYSIKVKEKENLLVEIFGEDGIPLALEIIKQAENKNINVFFNIINYSILKELLKNCNEEQIKLYAKHDFERIKDMDAYIGISAKNRENELEGILAEKMELYNKEYMALVHINERVKKKWCILRYPNKFFAEKNNMDLKEAEEYYFNVCSIDYAKLALAMDNLVELLNKSDKVRIIGENTDISFSIKGIKAEKYIGNFNLPDGEVATAPIKDSVNGFITYNTETVYSGQKFKNIRFEFKDGKIINATCDKTEELNKILDTDAGARYIGEFAFGLNPFVRNVSQDVLFDEKIYGSFHLTPGNSLSESDNGNRSAIHWDIVNIQTKDFGGGEIWVDNTLIRKDGRFVIKKLECLNLENLI